jgi:hypothetical protein
MALRAFRTVTTEDSTFEVARARWEAVRRARQELKARLAGVRAALGFAENPPGKGDVISPVLAERARAYLAGRKPNAELLRREILALEDEIAQAATSYSIEATSWKLALEAEARRRVEALRPRHRATVRKIAAAVEALSAAVEQERGIRRELGEVGSSALVDASYEFGSLAEYGSLVSTWNRRLLQAGVLDP